GADPTITFDPDNWLVEWWDKSLTGRALSSVPAAVALALSREAHLNSQEVVRDRAARLLDRMLKIPGAPTINLKAKLADRQHQFATWEKWWRSQENRVQWEANRFILR